MLRLPSLIHPQEKPHTSGKKIWSRTGCTEPLTDQSGLCDAVCRENGAFGPWIFRVRKMTTPSFSSVPEAVEHYDRLLYRLVMTKDEQLEASIGNYLSSILEALGTPHEPVRNKVRVAVLYAQLNTPYRQEGSRNENTPI